MARPREFDPDTAVEKALEVFWADGYEATSLADLTRAMGLSKSSFYDTFGSKRELFFRTIDHFCAAARARHVEEADRSDSTPDFLRRLLQRQVEAARRPRRRQVCYLGRCALEAAGRDRGITRRVGSRILRFEEFVRAAIERGQREGEISTTRSAADLARYIVSTFYGLQVLATTGASCKALAGVVDTALDVLE